MHSEDSSVEISESIMKSLSSNSMSSGIFEFHKSSVNFTRVIIDKVNMNTQQKEISPSIINFIGSTASMNMILVKTFNSQLITALSSSYLELSNSDISGGNNLQMYKQDQGLALSIIQSSASIFNTRFTYLQSKVGPAICAFDIPQSSELKNVTV